MTIKDFDTAVEDLLYRIEVNLESKADEYAADHDRLHNFNQGSRITGESREKVLFGFMLKHIISTMDMIEDLDKSKMPSQAMLLEKLGDLGTYTVLLHACFQDRLNNKRPF